MPLQVEIPRDLISSRYIFLFIVAILKSYLSAIFLEAGLSLSSLNVISFDTAEKQQHSEHNYELSSIVDVGFNPVFNKLHHPAMRDFIYC